ncbi:hypothetical protein P152DRAFT_478139 [Eremomyces bilateralis CBS 781.70]|uniref:Uncharacterized protein n=1 Tax=Eremomyces bilateralis CBS 781.70 TaxID=1392243 RepID=A0A6G1GGB6_9PEZI|nr:uncharacterized protein P152DRAFT_478139 [Eremomyces bilateralis CBS 781.70]KAF1817093.1 hypothetical protein P152DRAFT_478139 [Eremomyces bilateralis CBS 781.70]
MAPAVAPCLYIGTRLSLEQADETSTIAITLPSAGASISTTQRAPVEILPEIGIGEDENDFGRRHISTEGSIHFFPHTNGPRSLLWRLLDERTTLELQTIDLTQHRSTKADPTLTLQFKFSSPVRTSCVAFPHSGHSGDGKQTVADPFDFFVLTTANELYSLRLPWRFFVPTTANKPIAAPSDASVFEQEPPYIGVTPIVDWCNLSKPQAFAFKYPYRLLASSASELLVSTHEGTIIRLERGHSNNVSGWRETYYSLNDWSKSLKSLLTWKSSHSVRFEGLELYGNAAASLAQSPDKRHIFTVCLDHTLRAWNLHTGKVGMEADLAGAELDDPERKTTFLLDPSKQDMLQILDVSGQDGDAYYVVTYSPHTHQFKFWGIWDADETEKGFRDIQSSVRFIPPVDELMNTSVWTLENFHIKPSTGWRQTELWIRARSGPTSRVFGLKFSLFGPQKTLEGAWKRGWVYVDSGLSSADALKSQCPIDFSQSTLDLHNPTMTERWLRYLFKSGTFSVPCLESALTVYFRGTGIQVQRQSAKNIPLKERVSFAIEHHAMETVMDEDYQNPDAHELAIGAQWQIFFGLVRDLHKSRTETLALCLDDHTNTPWLVEADFVSVVRKCSTIDLSILNHDTLLHRPKSAPMTLTHAFHNKESVSRAPYMLVMREFRAGLPASFQEVLERAVSLEAMEEPSVVLLERLSMFEAQCGLCELVSDDLLSKLAESMDELGGFKTLKNQLFYDIIEELKEDHHGHQHKLDLTRYGAEGLLQGTRETLSRTFQVLLDLLVFVIFVAIDIDSSVLSSEFDPSEIYNELSSQLKEQCILRWLNETYCTGEKSPYSKELALDPRETVMQSMFMGDWHHIPSPNGDLSTLLTYWCRAWVSGLSLSQEFDNITGRIASYLLQHGEVQNTSDFLRFLPVTPWTNYLRARVKLTLGDFAEASILFKKSSFMLGEGQTDIEQVDAGILKAQEKEAFGGGVGQYYLHVGQLYEAEKYSPGVIEFARLAQDALEIAPQEADEASLAELNSCYLHACLQIHDYEEAYLALCQSGDKSQQKQGLEALIKAMLQHSTIKQLFHGLPFASFYNEVDDILVSMCRNTLDTKTAGVLQQMIYTWRISRNDHRGAAGIMYSRIQRLRDASETVNNPADETLAQSYLVVINSLSLVDPDNAWILTERRKGGQTLVTLDDVRREYQAELDRISAIEHGQFGFVEDDDEDIL